MTAAESDLRGETALAIMALLTWAEFHGGITPIIDGTVERFITAGKPHDAGINRAIANTRSALARYIANGGRTPAWLPASVLSLVNEPWCAADLATTSIPKSP
jgi:hypothetical protein